MTELPVPDWHQSRVRQTTNAKAHIYKTRRWESTRALRWDYEKTRATLLDELQPKPGERLMEIGCGPGTWTSVVGSHGAEVTAVDISENMIVEAKRATAGMKTSFIHCDFMSLSLNQKFDGVYSARAIEYMRPLPAVVERVSRLVKPGGRVVLITKPRFSIWRGRTKLLYRTWPFSKMNHVESPSITGRTRVIQYPVSPHELARGFRSHGFRVVRVRPVILRLPIFASSFHEFPLIPDALAAPALWPFEALYQAGKVVPTKLSAIPLFLSESFCITLRHDGETSPPTV